MRVKQNLVNIKDLEMEQEELMEREKKMAKKLQLQEEEEPAANYGPNQGPNRASQGVNLRVERGTEKRELRGVDKGVMEERIINIIIN
jgi:hypothetical protein